MVFHRTASDSSRFFYSILFIIWCFYSACLADAAITNRTIDDSLGDLVTGQKVIYEPVSIWQTFNYSLASGGTFTRAQSTGDISATITFNGAHILPNISLCISSDVLPQARPSTSSSWCLPTRSLMIYHLLPASHWTTDLLNPFNLLLT